jgi:hypothetical protein
MRKFIAYKTYQNENKINFQIYLMSIQSIMY